MKLSLLVALVLLSGCAAGGRLAGVAADTPRALTAEEVAENMLRSIGSTPVLRVHADIETDGELHHAEAWMSATRFRGDIWHDGRLVYASFMSGGRVQEFYPTATVAKDIPLTNVLIEYDGPESTGGWPVFQTSRFGCDVVGAIGDSWVAADRPTGPTIPELMAERMRKSTLSTGQFEGRPCYMLSYTQKRGLLETDRFEYLIDEETYKPVRKTLTIIEGTKTTVKRDTYRFEHFQDDRGVEWLLDPAKLRDAAKPPSRPTGIKPS